MKKWAVGLLAAALCAAGAWAGTVTYTVTGTNSVEVSGDVPQGAGAVYASMGSQKFRLTAGDGMTLTLSGYEGFAITNLVLEMKSNKSGGAGSLLVTCGEETVLAEIGNAGFDSTNWHGGWSTNWVEVSPDVTATAIDGDVVISIDATANSLYCQSFTIGYAAADTGAVALPFLAYNGPWVGVEGFASKGVVDLEDSVEFDDTGDWLRIRFDGVPGQVAYEIDEFSFNEDSAFLVQESADGECWTTLATWKVQEPTHYHQVAYHELSGASRYVRFFFETKGEDNADVRISNVNITEGGPVWPVSVAEGIANGAIAVDRDVAKEGETVTVSATADPGYKLALLSVNGEPLGHGVTTFEMPGGAAEVSATFAADWVTLPFPEGQPYQGPWTDDEIGFATEGVVDRGEDVKFDDAGDWLQIRFDGVPGILSYVIGDFMFYENVPSTFLVQESADGANWTPLATWISGELGNTQTMATNDLASDTRCVRFFYATKGAGNVGISSVYITAGETESPSIAYTGETVVAPGGTFSIAFTLDNYDDPFTWALTAGNGTLNGDGNYTWTPDGPGIYPITVAALADGGTVDSLSLQLEVSEPGPGPTPVPVKLTSIRVDDQEADGEPLRRVTLTIDNPDVQFMVKRTYDLGSATSPAVWTNVDPTAHFTGGTATFDEPASRAYYRVGESE